MVNAAASNSTIFGGAANGQLIVSGSGGLSFNGSFGSGTVIAGGGNNLISVLHADPLLGVPNGAQNIIAGPGNDTIIVLEGNDTVDGGTGNNQILTGAGDDIIFSNGNDLISAGSQTISLSDGTHITFKNFTGLDAITNFF